MARDEKSCFLVAPIGVGRGGGGVAAAVASGCDGAGTVETGSTGGTSLS